MRVAARPCSRRTLAGVAASLRPPLDLRRLGGLADDTVAGLERELASEVDGEHDEGEPGD